MTTIRRATFGTPLNSFTLNKIKLTLASPAVDKDKWDAAYPHFVYLGFGRAHCGYRQPYHVAGTSVAAGNGFSWIREAYIELNAPIGTGLDLRAGDLISLLNYESGDGGAVNDNFSQSTAWYYTGNPPNVGIQAGYDFTIGSASSFVCKTGFIPARFPSAARLSSAASISSPSRTCGWMFWALPDTRILALLLSLLVVGTLPAVRSWLVIRSIQTGTSPLATKMTTSIIPSRAVPATFGRCLHLAGGGLEPQSPPCLARRISGRPDRVRHILQFSTARS
jgi:hypothetical protein